MAVANAGRTSARDRAGDQAALLDGLTFSRRRQIFLLLMGMPAVVYVLAVSVWPLSQGIYFSFFDYSLLAPAARSFVGLENYRELWTDPVARGSIVTTVLFTVAAVSLQFGLGLGLALLLWRDSAFHRVCLALLLIPVTMTPLVVGLVARALLGPDFGMLGYFFSDWGLSSPRGLLGDPATALGTLVVIDTWQWTPFMALILLAGLKSLPTDVLEAAEVDGATAGQRLRLIILPLLLPAILLAVVLRTMDAFRVFDIVFATTNGGPGEATNVLMVNAVKQGLQFFNVGFAAAIANTAMLCIAAFSIAFILLIRRADRRANER